MPERRSKTLVYQFQGTLIARMAFYAVIYHFTLWNFLVFRRSSPASIPMPLRGHASRRAAMGRLMHDQLDTARR